MGGIAHTNLKVGDPCIIYVDAANRPSGYWFGIVREVGEKTPSWDCWPVKADLLTPYNQELHYYVGTSIPTSVNTSPGSPENYTVFAFNPSNCMLVNRILSLADSHRELWIRLDECRSLLRRDDVATPATTQK